MVGRDSQNSVPEGQTVSRQDILVLDDRLRGSGHT